jgi:hypothetical protein
VWLGFCGRGKGRWVLLNKRESMRRLLPESAGPQQAREVGEGRFCTHQKMNCRRQTNSRQPQSLQIQSWARARAGAATYTGVQAAAFLFSPGYASSPLCRHGQKKLRLSCSLRTSAHVTSTARESIRQPQNALGVSPSRRQLRRLRTTCTASWRGPWQGEI